MGPLPTHPVADDSASDRKVEFIKNLHKQVEARLGQAAAQVDAVHKAGLFENLKQDAFFVLMAALYDKVAATENMAPRINAIEALKHSDPAKYKLDAEALYRNFAPYLQLDDLLAFYAEEVAKLLLKRPTVEGEPISDDEILNLATRKLVKERLTQAERSRWLLQEKHADLWAKDPKLNNDQYRTFFENIFGGFPQKGGEVPKALELSRDQYDALKSWLLNFSHGVYNSNQPKEEPKN